uniref:HDC12578 n=1 Tax=Drosophila melanogaster TaxID=7227 RepID=Q6IKF5_DROME|nr:TPA_inf: HDC12578 [Drosophila melanogaster]
MKINTNSFICLAASISLLLGLQGVDLDPLRGGSTTRAECQFQYISFPQTVSVIKVSPKSGQAMASRVKPSLPAGLSGRPYRHRQLVIWLVGHMLATKREWSPWKLTAVVVPDQTWMPGKLCRGESSADQSKLVCQKFIHG